MYIWTAIDVDSQLSALRKTVNDVTEKLKADNSALTLPLHISLRMSFFIADAEYKRAVRDIGEYLRGVRHFEVGINGIEKHGNVVWCAVGGCSELSAIHSDLLEMMSSDFGVGAHSFDNSFIYHSTLFFSEDEQMASEAFEHIKNEPFPEKLTVNSFLIGLSETGKAGDFKVTERINALL